MQIAESKHFRGIFFVTATKEQKDKLNLKSYNTKKELYQKLLHAKAVAQGLVPKACNTKHWECVARTKQI